MHHTQTEQDQNGITLNMAATRRGGGGGLRGVEDGRKAVFRNILLIIVFLYLSPVGNLFGFITGDRIHFQKKFRK